MLHKYLHSWDVISTDLRMRNQRKIYRNDLEQLEALNQEYCWSLDLDRIVSKDYDALVLTNFNQVIEWVNGGFERMTGCAAEESVGRRPGFLQGPKTSELAKGRLRTGIHEERDAYATLINYRKCGNPYKCKISILPLKNAALHTTHFLAIEKEVT